MIPYFSSCIPAFTYESMSTNEQSFHDEELYPDIYPLKRYLCTSNSTVNGDCMLAKVVYIQKSCTISMGKYHLPPMPCTAKKSLNQNDKTTKTPAHDHKSLPPLAYATPECAGYAKYVQSSRK